MNFLITLCTILSLGTLSLAQYRQSINNGSIASLSDIPYQATLHVAFHNIPNRRIECGGTIVNTSWVATTAHCLTHADGSTATAIQIRFFLTDLDDHNSSVRFSTETVIHKQFSTSSFSPLAAKQNDIALVKLNEPVPMTNVIPIDFAYNASDHLNDFVVVSGFDSILHWGNMLTTDTLKCGDSFDVLCFDTHELSSPCSGGLATPIVWDDPGDKVRKLIAIVSAINAECPDTRFVTGVRLGGYRQWIEENINRT